MLQCVEVSSPKTINITQFLNTNNFSVNNRHFAIKSSQTSQLYISLIFDCITGRFTEVLITILSTAESETPASIRTFITSVFPIHAAWC